MADIKISELSAALTVGDSDVLPMTASGTTVKVSTALLKEHAIGDNNISALGDGSATGAILAVKSASESADDDIVSTMVQNGAHNLLQNNGTSQVINDVTFTVNADKSVTVSSSNNQSNAYFWVAKNFILPSGNYKVRGSKSGAMIYIGHESTDTWSEVGIDTDFSITSDGSTPWSVFIYVPDGTSGTRTTYPMIRLASDPSTAYAPHAMTNRDLTNAFALKSIHTDTLSGNSDVNIQVPVTNVRALIPYGFVPDDSWDTQIVFSEANPQTGIMGARVNGTTSQKYRVFYWVVK